VPRPTTPRAGRSVITPKASDMRNTIDVQWRLGKCLFDSRLTTEGLRTLKDAMERAGRG